ncbi:TPA: YjbQ family protein [Candidatus Poribacteria bacterium]|nr:YjbQ family protein [Candidatus Poribacteria bacterium]
MIHKFNVKTRSRVEFIDITPQVREIVRGSGVKEGVCYVFAPHTTAAITINENADPNVVRDIIYELNKVIPFQDAYAHIEGNSAAHIKSTIVGASEVILVEGGDLLLGTWQAIYFCEFDGPRTRRVFVKVAEC